jgi:hypothetical protein
MKAIDWNSADGCALQGDICLFRIPDDIAIDTADEIAPRDNALVLAEGEVTGHHHAIRFMLQPVMFRDDGLARDLGCHEAKARTTARLFADRAAASALLSAGLLTTDRLFIGILVIDGAPMTLSHDEHDPIRIPVGRYYVGGQQEFDAGEARRVMD